MRGRRARIAAAVVTGLLLAADWTRPPERQLTARAELAVIDLYQVTLSGRFGVRCRFEPTCSHYGEAVIRRRGAARGTALAVWRILRCGPWTPAGTVDPPA
ncbi:MAG: membrane protein insertion efficiency factor YidD [Thermoanaerobaculia bacterium]